MGAMRKAGVWLGLVEDDESRAYERDYERTVDRRSDSYADNYDADDLEFEEEFEEPAPPPVPLRKREPRAKEPRFGDHVGARPNSRNVNSPTGSHMLIHDNLALAPQVALRDRSMLSEEAEAESESYRITTLHPNTYNEARVIGEHFRDGIPVIMNLTEMDESDAKRLVDFSAGLAFGLRGSIERVTNRVFLLSPANVSVTAEDKARIAGGGFFNQS